MDALLYLLRVSVCLGVFYSIYLILFRNITFFTLNRIYLLAGLILSFGIPAVQLSFAPPDDHSWSTAFITSVSDTVSGYDPGVPLRAGAPSSDHTLPLVILYWAGFAIMTFRLLYSMAHILTIKKRSTVFRRDQLKIVRTDSRHPFSFFNLVFLPNRDVDPLVIEHEKVHVRQLHWIDLLVTEMAGIVLWFNPLMIFYKRSVKTQHEYLADAGATGDGVPLEHYLECMLRQIQLENSVGPVSQFYYSKTIKNRIHMMTKNKTPRKFSALYLVTLPVLGMLLFAFSDQPVPALSNHTPTSKDDQTVIMVDAGHGGHDTGAHGNGELSEKEFVLSIAKKIQQAGEEKGIKVTLTRLGDEALTLEERTALAKRSGADLFISLHASFDAQDNTASGMACIVSERNAHFSESKRFAAHLVKELKTLRGIAINGIKTSNPYVLKNNNVPAVLLELGYLSNTADFAYIRNEKNQEQISERIIASVIQYIK